MNRHRRAFLKLAATAATLSVLPDVGWAQAYPSKPIRLLVGFAPGGGQDILARLIGNWLSEKLGQQIVIENRPGQAASIAAEAVVRSPPDGYTLYLIGPNNAINHTLYDNLSFDIVKDLQHVAALVTMPNVMSVHPSVPANNVAEFIAYAKANPGKLNFVRQPEFAYRPHQARQAPGARRDHNDTLARAPGRARRGRHRAGL